MSIFSALPIVGSVIGGIMGDDDREEAAEIAAASRRQAMEMANQRISKMDDAIVPYQKAGSGAINRLWRIMQGLEDPTAAMESSPGYQFRVNEANRALDRSQAARGNLISGNAIDEIAELNQGLAASEFDKLIQRLMQTSQIGGNMLTSNNQIAAGLLGMAGNNAVGAGDAQAAGIIGGGNSMIQGLTGGIDLLAGGIKSGDIDIDKIVSSVVG